MNIASKRINLLLLLNTEQNILNSWECYILVVNKLSHVWCIYISCFFSLACLYVCFYFVTKCKILIQYYHNVLQKRGGFISKHFMFKPCLQ